MLDKVEDRKDFFNFDFIEESNELALKRDSLRLITIELKLPCKLSVEEIIHRLCYELEEHEHEMPQSTNYTIKNGFERVLVKHYLMSSDEIRKELTSFLKIQNQNYYDKQVKNALNSQKTGLFSKRDLTNYWNTLNSIGHRSTNEAVSKMEELSIDSLNNNNNTLNNSTDSSSFVLSSSPLFAKMYQSLLIDSHELMSVILKRERNFMIEFNNLIHERDRHLKMLLETSSESDKESMKLEKNKWKLRIDCLKSIQQRKFRKFITKLYECKENELLSTNSEIFNEKVKEIEKDLEIDTEINGQEVVINETKQHLLKESKMVTNNAKRFTSSSSSMSSLKRIEESYTIQLGAQLKTTHNLRLIRCDILDYCKDRFKTDINSNNVSDSTDIMDLIEPQSILTAMSLYSENLCGLVLLVDKSINERLEQILDNNGCDFHFLSIEQQMQSSMKTNMMNIGDFYLTKHSNLSQCHVVFHLISQTESKEEQELINLKSSDENRLDVLSNGAVSASRQTLKHSDLSSRHPVILGLRNILKSCINHNIQTLTFPLLLTHEMTDEMTINWVMKRAELVLKCIKGFMIEFVQWGAQESRTLQFVVPQGLMDETFNSLSNLVKTIFRESRTVNLN